MRRDITRALATPAPVTDPQHAALTAELAAAGRGARRRETVVGAVIGLPIGGAITWFLLDRFDERSMSMFAFLIILIVAFAVAIGLISFLTVRVGRKLAEAERINHALHQMWADPASTETFAKLERASDLGFPGLREVRASIVLNVALVVTVTMVFAFSEGPRALEGLTPALFLGVLWLWARTALRGVAIVLIVVQGIGVIDFIPPSDVGEGATLAVLLTALALAVVGLVRSRVYRRALKAEREALLGDSDWSSHGHAH